jgi:hypothetical protein
LWGGQHDNGKILWDFNRKVKTNKRKELQRLLCRFVFCFLQNCFRWFADVISATLNCRLFVYSDLDLVVQNSQFPEHVGYLGVFFRKDYIFIFVLDCFNEAIFHLASSTHRSNLFILYFFIFLKFIFHFKFPFLPFNLIQLLAGLRTTRRKLQHHHKPNSPVHNPHFPLSPFPASPLPISRLLMIVCCSCCPFCCCRRHVLGGVVGTSLPALLPLLQCSAAAAGPGLVAPSRAGTRLNEEGEDQQEKGNGNGKGDGDGGGKIALPGFGARLPFPIPRSIQCSSGSACGNSGGE